MRVLLWTALCVRAVAPAQLPLFFHEYTSVLPPALLDRSVAYASTLRGPWQAFIRKLEGGEPLTVGALGGSVTVGHKCAPGCSGAPSYTNTFSRLVFDALAALSPLVNHSYINGGVPATAAPFFAACLQYRVPPDADLVLLEFATNGIDDADTLAGVEGVVRRLLHRPHPPALLLVDWNRHCPGIARALNRTVAEHFTTGWFGVSGGVSTTYVSEAYDVPRVSLKNALLEEDWHQTLPEFTFERFAGDWSHPNAWGHKLVAAAVLHFVSAASVRVHGARHLRGDAQQSEPRTFLPPLVPGNDPERGASSCWFGTDLAPLGTGWDFDTHDPEKLAFSTTGAGPSLKLRIPRRKGSSQLTITYLKGHELGSAALSCAPQCGCGAGRELHAHVDGPGHVFHAEGVAFDAPARGDDMCDVEVAPKGAFKVAALIVSSGANPGVYGSDSACACGVGLAGHVVAMRWPRAMTPSDVLLALS